jgi:hypothetical protein
MSAGRPASPHGHRAGPPAGAKESPAIPRARTSTTTGRAAAAVLRPYDVSDHVLAPYAASLAEADAL